MDPKIPFILFQVLYLRAARSSPPVLRVVVVQKLQFLSRVPPLCTLFETNIDVVTTRRVLDLTLFPCVSIH